MGQVKKAFDRLPTRDRATVLIEAAVETYRDDGDSLESAVINSIVFLLEEIVPITGATPSARNFDIEKRRSLCNQAQMLADHPASPAPRLAKAAK